MSFYVWVEYICSHCQEFHRTRFDVQVGSTAGEQLRGNIHEENGLFIRDIAVNLKTRPKRKGKGGGSKIYVKLDTPISKIADAVTNYMVELYAVKEGTLKVEVCGY